MEFIREHKRGIIGTIIFHVIVLLMLIFLGFFTPLPLPGEEGILVNFGTSDNGFGEEEPAPANSEAAQAESVQQEAETAPPPPVQSQPTPQPKPAEVKESILTQDYEKTAAIDAAENKKKVEEQNRKNKLEQDRLRKEEQDKIIKQQQAETERIRKAEAEKRAKAEAEQKAREEQDRKISDINSRTQGAFASKGTGAGGKGQGEGTSQGTTYPGGNQGVPTGEAGADNYGPGGSGSGSKGSGISFSLAGRSATSLPKPKYPGDDEGVVVVKVTVDKFGNVTAAEPGKSGTTISDTKFWEEAKQAALKAKFNTDDNAPAYQQGTITYRFVLN